MLEFAEKGHKHQIQVLFDDNQVGVIKYNVSKEWVYIDWGYIVLNYSRLNQITNKLRELNKGEQK